MVPSFSSEKNMNQDDSSLKVGFEAWKQYLKLCGSILWRFYMINLKKLGVTAARDIFWIFDESLKSYTQNNGRENFLIDHFLSFVQIVPCPFLKPSFWHRVMANISIIVIYEWMTIWNVCTEVENELWVPWGALLCFLHQPPLTYLNHCF